MKNFLDQTKIKQTWEQAVKHLKDAKINPQMQKLISNKDFEEILGYVESDDFKNYLLDILKSDPLLENNERIEFTHKGDNLKIAIPFDSNNTKCARSFALTYDKNKNSFDIDIYLNQKTAELNQDGKSVKQKADKGSFNKYTRLLTVELQANQAPNVNMNYGRLVLMDNKNASTAKKIVLQQVLAEMDICLDIDILPVGKKGKISQKVVHAQSLDKYQGSPQEMMVIYKDIIEKMEKLRLLGIVHGDLKPENILIHNGRAYIADLDTFGFANELHIPQGTLYFMPRVEVLPFLGMELQEDVSPVELRKAITYSHSADLYALANLINKTSKKNNLSGDNLILGKIEQIVQAYLNPRDDSYTKLNDNINPSAQSLSLHDLYKKMFNAELNVSIDATQKKRTNDSLRSYVESTNLINANKCWWAIEQMKRDKVRNLVENISVLNENLTENLLFYQIKPEILPGNIENLLAMVNDKSLSLKGKVAKLDAILSLDEGLLSMEFMVQHTKFMKDPNRNQSELDVYKQKVLLASQVLSLIIMQVQTHNLTAKASEIIDIADLLQKDNALNFIIEQVAVQQIKQQHKKDGLTFSTAIPHALEHHESPVTLVDFLAPTIYLDDIFYRRLNQGETVRDLAKNYAYGLYSLGKPFSKISLYSFKQLTVDEQKLIIEASERHVQIVDIVLDQLAVKNKLLKSLNYYFNDVKNNLTQMQNVLALNSVTQQQIATKQASQKSQSITKSQWDAL